MAKKTRKPKALDTDAMAEKKPPELGTSDDSSNNSTIDSTTEDSGMSISFGSNSADDKAKGRHFWFVIYPTEAWIKANCPNCTYDGREGWGTAPDDWQEQLQQTGLAFCVSPLHWLDVNPDGHTKKPHWHVIVSWGNTTTYKSARALCDILHSPRPILLRNVTGAYRYHQHLDNPEKYQYTELSKAVNGWERPLDMNEVNRIKGEIFDMIFNEDITEYAELTVECMLMGPEYFDVVSSHTHFFDKLCTSYRHNPLKTLKRYYNGLKEGERKEEIKQRIERYGELEELKCINDFDSESEE